MYNHKQSFVFLILMHFEQNCPVKRVVTDKGKTRYQVSKHDFLCQICCQVSNIWGYVFGQDSWIMRFQERNV